MAKCSHCGSMILFGGVRDGEARFCNADCQQGGYLLAAAARLPEDEVRQAIAGVHHGLCPVCGGAGPNDVFTRYKVWSAGVLTSWRSDSRISCRSCGVKGQLSALAYCFFLGWWGIPWGLVMTPVQILRNLKGMSTRPDPYSPSSKLEETVRLGLASHLLQGADGAVAGA